MVVLSIGGDGTLPTGHRAVLAVLLLAGWVGLTVAGALLHLLWMLGRIRGRHWSQPTPRPLLDTSVTLAAGLAVVMLAIGQGLQITSLTLLGSVALLGVAALLGGRIVMAASRLIRSAPPTPGMV